MSEVTEWGAVARGFERLVKGHASLRAGRVVSSRHDHIVRFLDEYRAIRDCAQAADAPDAGQVTQQTIARLLEGYRLARERADASIRTQARREREQAGRVLTGFGAARRLWEQNQVTRADAFNLVAVLQLTGKEIRHSMVLAWLLSDRTTGLGSHAQGNLGFRLFLEKAGLPAAYADAPYWVRREVSGDESRIDIEIAARGRFVIHIENKIWSGEGAAQTTREASDLQRRAADLGVAEANQFGFFLTPTGRKPEVGSRFRAVSWGQMARVVETFAALAQAPEVQLFALHYAKALRRFVVSCDRKE